jgi:hypothetical protein
MDFSHRISSQAESHSNGTISINHGHASVDGQAAQIDSGFNTGQGSLGNRARSSSNVSTSFPSSHDAFGLSASPSATSNMARAAGTGSSNNTSRSGGPWAHSGASGYGFYGISHNNATMMADTSSNSPSGNQFAHGVLPPSTLLGDPQFRMNRPSGLSQAWGGEEEAEDSPSGPANSDVEQWRHTLDPPTQIRRSHSSFASIPHPKSPQNDANLHYGLHLTAPSSSSRFSMALRRVSSEHSAVKDSSEVTTMYNPREERTSLGQDPDRRTPPKGFQYPFGGKLRDSIDGMEAGGSGAGGSVDPDRGLGTGFSSARRRSNMMDTAQPRLLPPNLRKTLAAEANLPMQEIRSEALLQRLILSNSDSLPMTPRPSRHGRMLNSFPEAESDDSDDEPDDGNSSDEGPFAVDDLVSGDDLNQGMGSMDVDMSAPNSSPFAFSMGHGSRTPRYSVRPNCGAPSRGNTNSAGLGGFGQSFGTLGEDRNEARASQGSARGSDVSDSLACGCVPIASHCLILVPDRQATMAWIP